MTIADIFRNESQHLFWKRFEPDHIIGNAGQATPIETDQAYFLLRMKEMYLLRTRRLWRKFYPMLHSYISYSNNQEEHGIAGPGQLKEFGETNLDRVINLNYRLGGPIAYKGGDVSILIGLYSIPGEDASKALIDTIGTIANLGGFALEQSMQIANALKTGVEKIVGISEAKLELGIRDTFFPGNPFRSGYYVGISAPEVDIPFNKLWLRDGRLVKGNDPSSATPYEDFDYFVVELERRDHRDDWGSLPGIAEFQDRFSAIMRDASLAVAQKRDRLKALWPEFTQAIKESPYLVQPDEERISGDVSTDLVTRLKNMEENNPFETTTRGMEQERDLAQDPSNFDFVDVPEYTDMSNAESKRKASASLAGNPFAS